MSKSAKPLNAKAYGHIGHLPCSRMGPGDHSVHEGQARIATVKTRDRHDYVIVEEKLDGSCVAIAKIEGRIVPLIRAGYEAKDSRYPQHHIFAAWVFQEYGRWEGLILEGERIVGEWLAQAHGTRYKLPHEPFVAFDLMHETERATREEFRARLTGRVTMPRLLYAGPAAFSVEAALRELGQFGHHGALDPVEGAVWRVERQGAVDFLCKYVRPDKQDGIYLPEISGQAVVWNWQMQG